MLIFHEDNKLIEKLNCANNVKKINLKADGLAKLIVNAILSNHTENNVNSQSLLYYMKIALGQLPYLLAQYKIGVNIIL